MFLSTKALCKIGLACTNNTVSPAEGCQCGSTTRCEAGKSCVTSSLDSPGLCIAACSPSTDTAPVLALALCGCSQTVCLPGQTCDMAASQCVLPCENPSLLPDNNLETAGSSTHLLGQQEFNCKPGYYMKIKQVKC